MPENVAFVRLARAFVQAWRLYGVRDAIVLFITHDNEINIGDQRQTEYEMTRQEPAMDVDRCSLGELATYGKLTKDMRLY